jgi:hypothetical protein
VLGALHLPNTSDRIIDFANPRKRVEKKKPVGLYILGGAAATALLAAAWWGYSSSHSTLDQDIKVLKDEIAGQTPILKTAGKNLADWKKVETFMQGDVLWVDELERLSVNAKDADTTYFSATTFNLDPRTNEPTILTKFLTKEKDLVPEIEAAYRDTKHNVRETGLAQSQDKKYPVAADMKITVATAEVKDPRKVERKPIEDSPASEPKTEPNAQAPKEPETQGAEPATTEPAKTEPAKTEPATTQPTTTEPTKPEPTTTVPATNEPVTTEPAKTEPTKPEPTATEPAKPAAEPILGGAS